MKNVTDKERILMCIVTKIIPGLMCSPFEKRDEYAKSFMMNPLNLQKGDLVFANTTFEMNDFIVGFVDHVERDYVVIREIGSNRLCNYGNEAFTRINAEKLGYEILEGVQYKTYKKVYKAFEAYTQYYTRFRSIAFDGNMCTVEARKAFKNEKMFKVTFAYNAKTTIKEIGKRLKEAEAALAGGDGNG